MKKFLFSMIAVASIVAGYFFIKTMPTASSIPANRLSYSGNGIQFHYPENFGSPIWKAITWPPKVTVVSADKDPIALGCPILKDSAMITESGAGESNDTPYSFIKGEDVGAGQRYTSTCYLFSGNKVNYVIEVAIHSPLGCGKDSCGAYCDTENEQACKAFDMEKDVDQIMEKILSTVNIK